MKKVLDNAERLPYTVPMMTNATAAAYSLDAVGILHRPNGQIASRAERMSWDQTAAAALYAWIVVEGVKLNLGWAVQEMAATVDAVRQHQAARRMIAAETRPEKAPRLLWKVEADRIASARRWGHI